MTLRRLAQSTILAALISLSFVSIGRADPAVKTLTLTQPQERATVAGGVSQGQHAYYSFTIPMSQTLVVGISSTDNNAGFAIYDPGAVFKDEGGQFVLTGATEKGAAEGDGTIKWSGKLLKPGTYLIDVGSAHGTASYYMTVWLRP